MATILDMARETYRAYSGSEPHNPDKSDIVSLWGMVASALEAIGITASVTVSKSTRSALYADLAHADGTLALVHSDSTAAYLGIYLKSGASGTGSWALKFQLPSTYAADLSAAIVDIGALEGDVAALEADVASINTALAGKASTGSVAALSAVVDTKLGDGDVAQTQARPGERPTRWTSALTGSPSAVTPLALGSTTDTDGRVVRLTGPGRVASREAVRLHSGMTMVVTATVRRRIATSDPSGDAVRLAIQPLDASFAAVGSPVVLNTWTALGPGDGAQRIAKRVGTAAGTGIDAVVPSGTVYVRRYVEQFGSATAVVDVEEIEWDDVTYTETWSPDLTALSNRVSALESLDAGDRLDDLEAAIAGVTDAAVAVPTLAALRGKVPASGQTARTLGYTAAGDGGHAFFKAVTGASPGTLVDDACRVIVPTGGDGSKAWVLIGDMNVLQCGGVADLSMTVVTKSRFTFTSNGTNQVTVSSATGLVAGMRMAREQWHSVSNQFPVGCTIQSISGTTLTMSATVASGSGRALAWKTTLSGTSNVAAYERLTSACIRSGRSHGYVTSGAFYVPGLIQGGYNGFAPFTLVGAGRPGLEPVFASWLVTDRDDTPLYNVQAGRQSGAEYLGFHGPNYAYGLAVEASWRPVSQDELDYIAPDLVKSGSNPGGMQRHAPLAAITVDAFTGSAPTAPYQRSLPSWTGMSSAYGSPSTSNYRFRSLCIRGFPVGIAGGLNDNQQGDFSEFYDVTALYGCRTIVLAGTQGRLPNINGVIAAGFHTILSAGITTAGTPDIGSDGGKFSGFITRVSGQNCYQLASINNLGSSGPIVIDGVYMEACARIGDFVGAPAVSSDVIIRGSEFLFAAEAHGIVPGSLITAGSPGRIEVSGCNLSGSAMITSLVAGGNVELVWDGGTVQNSHLPGSAAEVEALAYSGGMLAGSPRFNSEGRSYLRMPSWVRMRHSLTTGDLVFRPVGDEMRWSYSGGSVNRIALHQAAKYFHDDMGRRHEFDRTPEDLLNMLDTGSVPVAASWSDDTMTFGIAQSLYENSPILALRAGDILTHPQTGTVFVVSAVSGPSSSRYTVSAVQQNNKLVDPSTGAFEANLFAGFESGGYLVVIKTKIILPRQVYTGLFTKNSSTVTSVDRGDGYAGDLTTYIAANDEIWSHWRQIPGWPIGPTSGIKKFLTVTNGSPGSLTMNANAVASGRYAIFTVPLRPVALAEGLVRGALAAPSSLSDTDEFPVWQGGETLFRAALTQALTWIRGKLATAPVTIAEGGTGAKTAATARRALGVADFNIPKRRRVTGASWLSSTSAADNTWGAIEWADTLGLYAAVAVSGTGNRVMTSPDGVTWTSRTSAADYSWRALAWSPQLGLFAAVSDTGTGNRVMTSPDGITWTLRTSAADYDWYGLCWSVRLGLFVATSSSGVMTSPDGITWTLRTAVAGSWWYSVCDAPEIGLLVAVSPSGTNRVMTSPDGITWTARTAAATNQWRRVRWSPELGILVAVASTGTGNQVMTSPDGITWTSRTNAVDATWYGLDWAPEIGLWAAVAATGAVMTSPDGITWTSGTAAAALQWYGVRWSTPLGIYAAVAGSGTGNRVMTSVSAHTVTYRS